MNERPDGCDLLRTARAVLLKHVMPAAPSTLRYDMLMIANAMAIAARELEVGDKYETAEIAGLLKLLNAHAQMDAEADLDMSGKPLQRLRAALRAQIRRGAFDGEERRSPLLSHLARTTRDRLAVSNPKALST